VRCPLRKHWICGSRSFPETTGLSPTMLLRRSAEQNPNRQQGRTNRLLIVATPLNGVEITGVRPSRLAGRRALLSAPPPPCRRRPAAPARRHRSAHQSGPGAPLTRREARLAGISAKRLTYRSAWGREPSSDIRATRIAPSSPWAFDSQRAIWRILRKKQQPQCAFEVTFGKGQPFADMEVLCTLDRAINAVKEVRIVAKLRIWRKAGEAEAIRTAAE
jgi:hypothetical protein